MRNLITRIPANWLSFLLVILMIGIVALPDLLLSLLTFVCLLLVLAAANIHRSEWCERIQSGQLDKSTVRYVEHIELGSFVLLSSWGGYLMFAIMIGVSLGQIAYRGFSITQWVLIVIVISSWIPLGKLYLPMIYTITDQGIWIQDGISRAYLPFTCLDSVMHYPGKKGPAKGYIAYVSRTSDVVMLFLKNPVAIFYRKGPRWSRTVLLTPNDSVEFMAHLPDELLVEE